MPKLKRALVGTEDSYYASRYPGSTALPLLKSGRKLPTANESIPADLAGNSRYLLSSSKSVIQVYTIMPDGLRVAWSTCGACAAHVRVCSCAGGFVAPNSISHIWKKAAASLAGEEWGIHHPEYGRRTPRRSLTPVTSIAPQPAPKLRKLATATKLPNLATADADATELANEKLTRQRKLLRKRR